MYMCLMTKITHETLILNTFLYDCIVKINKMYVYLQGKLESRLEDNVYSIQGRLSKIESAVSRDRQIINDLQGVCFNIYWIISLSQVNEWLLFNVKWACQLYHGENKLHFDEMMMSVLLRYQHTDLDFFSASSLKQHSAGRHVLPLWHIILIPSQPVFAPIPELEPRYTTLKCSYSRARPQIYHTQMLPLQG
jgi:hypothetical protein